MPDVGVQEARVIGQGWSLSSLASAVPVADAVVSSKSRPLRFEGEVLFAVAVAVADAHILARARGMQ